MKSNRIGAVTAGLLCFATGGANPQTFEQQVLQISQSVAVMTQQTRRVWLASKVQEKTASGGTPAKKYPADALVQYGTVCRVGKDPVDALARVMSALNNPIVKLETDFSAYTGSRDTGEYLKGPYAVLGQAVSRRISVVIEYNWLSCLPVRGSL